MKVKGRVKFSVEEVGNNSEIQNDGAAESQAVSKLSILPELSSTLRTLVVPFRGQAGVIVRSVKL